IPGGGGAPDPARAGAPLPARGGPDPELSEPRRPRRARRAAGAGMGRIRRRPPRGARAVGPGDRADARPPRPQPGDRHRRAEHHSPERGEGGARDREEMTMTEPNSESTSAKEASLLARIAAGERVESADEMTADYKKNLIHLMTMQADSELAGAFGYVP